jgi:hypothetical protein
MSEDNDTSLKTDVALIKKDLKQIERFFGRFDTALASMADISQKVAVQGEILKNTVEKINELGDMVIQHKKEDIAAVENINTRLEEHRKSAYADHDKLAKESAENRKERNEEIMVQLAKMNGALDKKMTSMDDRIKLLEQWKWYIMGLGAAVIAIAANIQWNTLF